MNLINDIVAAINVILGLVVVVLEVRIARHNSTIAWVYYLLAVAGLGLALIFGYAFVDSCLGGQGIVPAAFGRPVVTMVLFAMAIAGIYQYRRGC